MKVIITTRLKAGLPQKLDISSYIRLLPSNDCRCIILEAPTGFGKSPVAISAALTLGTSYICTSTKDLQTQYARDFPFARVAKDKNNNNMQTL
ncbi:MAG: hypothetical protein WBZ36_21385 [Candidatus Nitrosopolaris sp.]